MAKQRGEQRGELIPAPVYNKKDVIAAVTKSLHQHWKIIENPFRNPCSQPVSLERKHMPLLSTESYVVADKSDGVRYTLFLTRASGPETAFLIDRKLDLYQIPVAANRKFFEGSIFDGELVWSLNGDGTWSQCFLVFDVVVLNGDDSIRNASLIKRIEKIRNLFGIEADAIRSPGQAHSLAKQGKIICGGNNHGLSFRPKQCFSLDMIDTLIRSIDTLPYQTDGLIFTPINTCCATGTDHALFKLKTFHTVDIECVIHEHHTGGCIEYLIGKGGGPDTARERLRLLDVTAYIDKYAVVRGDTFLYMPQQQSNGYQNADSKMTMLPWQQAQCNQESSDTALPKSSKDSETMSLSLSIASNFESTLRERINMDRSACSASSSLSYIVEAGLTLLPLDDTLSNVSELKIQLDFYTIRDDKCHPNSANTLRRTLINVCENITIEEIVRLLSRRQVLPSLDANAGTPNSNMQRAISRLHKTTVAGREEEPLVP